ncbi:MAG: AraC family transcriptional regulator [Bacteroidetes bacterium]|nr:MAG: AraC family transcriptional regulator [Bacteroidota bacterium]
MGTDSEIKTYHHFNDYYVDANALIRAKHDDFHAFRFSEAGDGLVLKMGPFRKSYYHFAIGRVLNAHVGVFDTRTITENYSLVVYLPGQIIHWEKTGDWDGYLVNVKEHFLNLGSIAHLTESYSFLHRMQPLVFNLRKADYQALSSFFELMLLEQQEMREENILVIRNLMQVMIVYVNRIVSQMKTTGSFVELQYQKVATRFKSLVFEHYIKNKTVAYYASLLGVTPAYLGEAVKKVFHTTPKDIINEIIFLHAKTLLSSTDTGIKELAWSLNFDDYSHFVKFFKKMNGLSPAEFRKQMKG